MTEVKTKQVILIVANPGNLQQGLQALLTVIRDVEVLVANEIASVLEVVESHTPSLLILDNDLIGDDVLVKMDRIKSRWPNIRWVILVNDEQQRQRVQEMDADLVLIKGFPAAKLIIAIKALLPD